MNTKRDGNWLDEWGACKVCGGEIPHGHSTDCDLYNYKGEMRERELRLEIERLRNAGEEALRHNDESHSDPCPVCGVHPEQCGCWIGMMRLAIGLSISKPKPTEPKP